MKKIQNLHKRESTRWLLGALLTLLSFLLTYMYFPVLFATNDDTRIMYALAGYASGKTYPAQQFINLLLGQILCFFYDICPTIPWYTLYHIVMLSLSITLINKSILKAFACRNHSLLHAIASIVTVYCIFFIHAIFMYQFTTTAAICGVSSVAVIMVWGMEGDTKSTRIIDAVCIVAMLFFGFILRAYSIYCVLCFSALAAVYRIGVSLRKNAENRHIAVKIGIMVLITAVSLICVRQYSLTTKSQDPRTVAYNSYNSYRTAYQDFPSKSYSDNEELYTSIGWDSLLYDATRKLQYLDSRYNEDNLRLLTEEFSLTGITADRSLTAASETAQSLLNSTNIPVFFLTGLVALFVINIVNWLGNSRKKDALIPLLCAVCGMGGFGIMMFYLCWNGRFPLRTMQTIIFPASVVQIMLVPFLKEYHKKKRFQFLRLIAAIISCACMFTAYSQVTYSYENLDLILKPATSTTVTMEDTKEFERYAMENPDNLYVYDFTVATVMRDAFCTYSDTRPINCIIAGGSYSFSALYYDQLAAMGRDQLYWTDLCDEGVFYVTESESFVKTVHANINRDMGYEVECVEVMRINVSGGNGIGIYKFIP